MELEKCPYCGEDAAERYADYNWNNEPYRGHIECEDCGASGPSNDPDGEKWNAVARALAERDEARRVARQQYADRLKTEAKNKAYMLQATEAFNYRIAVSMLIHLEQHP